MSSSSDDEPVPRPRNFGRDYGFYQQSSGFAIPRSMPQTASLEGMGDDVEEDFHDDFALSRFFENENSQTYAQFLNRDPGPDVPAAAPPMVTMQGVDIPESQTSGNATIEKALVQMLEIQNVVDANHQPTHFIHSWCDISAMTSVEAKRMIGVFFQNGYRDVEKSTWPIKAEINWGYNQQSANRYARAPQVLRPTIRIFHYVGLGYPPPEAHRIWLKDTSFSHGGWTRLNDLRSYLLPLCFCIFDCDRAAILRTFLMTLQASNMFDGRSTKVFFVLFSCAQNEMLRIPSHLPQNFFSCVLLSPGQAFSEVKHVKVADENAFVSLLDIVAESIALDSLPTDVFYRLFREHTSIASLWRRFLLAQRLMKEFGLHTQSIPEVADVSDHALWKQFDYGVMRLGEMNVIHFFSDLYLKHFDRVARPANYICALAATLLQVSTEKAAVLSKLAEFMVKSPANCELMASVLSCKYLGDFSAVARAQPSVFKNWSIVVSGIALTSVSLVKSIIGNSEDLAKHTIGKNDDELCAVYLTSILVCHKDGQSKMNCYIDSQTIEKLVPYLFTTSALSRQWVAILIHASIARYQVEPKSIGPSGIHAYASLLLHDNRKYTRAAGVAILTSLLAPNCPEFNRMVMKCAMKAALDGYSMIRLGFLYCAVRYTALNKDDCTEEGTYPLSFYIRQDLVKYASRETGEDKPLLRHVLVALSEDPDPTVREVAASILDDPLESAYLDAFQGHGTRIHQEAHMELFSRNERSTHMAARYDEELFGIDVLEMFEVRDMNQSKITFLGFDTTHTNVTCGCQDGTVWWGDNCWEVNDSVVSIVHLQYYTIAVATAAGDIYIFRSGIEKFLEVFRPSLAKPKSQTIMAVVPGSSKVFIAQGNNEILVWDLNALLLIDQITVASPPMQFVILQDKLLCALTHGSIVQIALDTHQIEREYAPHAGHRITKMLDSGENLCTVLENGAIYIWDTSDAPQLKSQEEHLIDIAIHKVYRKLIKITSDGAILTTNDSASISLCIEDKTPVCCCFDDLYPICAIGYSDGSYSTWRIPKT